MNENDIEYCRQGATYMGQNVYCNLTIQAGRTYNIYINFSSVHIYAHEIISNISNQTIVQNVTRTTTVVVEKAYTLIQNYTKSIDIEAQLNLTLVKNTSYATSIKITNTGTANISDISVVFDTLLNIAKKTEHISMLRAGESRLIPLEITTDKEGEYWIIATVSAQGIKTRTGIFVKVLEPEDTNLVKLIDEYKEQLNSIKNRLDEYADINTASALVEESLAFADSAYRYYSAGEYESVRDQLDKIKYRIIMLSKMPLAKGTEPSAQFIMTGSSEIDYAIIIIAIVIIPLLILIYFYKKRFGKKQTGRMKKQRRK